MQARTETYLKRTLPTVAILLLLTILSLGLKAQTTIAQQDFESTPATPTWSYSTSVTAGTLNASAPTGVTTYTTTTSDAPSGSNLFSGGSRGFAHRPNSTATTTQQITFGAVSTVGYSSIQASFRVAAFSIGSTGNGMDGATDQVLIEVSSDGGTTWYQQAILNIISGTALNTRWSFSGTGSSSRAYQANNTFTTFSVTGSTSATTVTGSSAITTITITGLPAVASLQFRITPTSNATSEVWAFDDVKIAGTPIAVSAPTINASSGVVASSPGATTNAYNGNTITINGTNLDAVTTVKVGGSSGTAATIASQSATTLTFALPAGASGVVYVLNSAGNATSTESITNLGYITTQTGGWATAATWLGGAVPTSASTSDITVAHNITGTSTSTSVGKLTVNSGISLTISSGHTYTVNTASTNSGTITNTSGTLTLAAAYTNAGTITSSGTVNVNAAFTNAAAATFSTTSTLALSAAFANGGTVNVNSGGTVQINNGGSASGTAFVYNQTSSTLIFAQTSGVISLAGTEPYWPSSNGPITVTLNSATSGVQLASGVSRSAGTINLSAGIDIQSAGGLTVTGTLNLNSGGSVTTNAPVYGSASTLAINTGGAYTITSTDKVWGPGTSGNGVPYKVMVSTSGTSVTLSDDRTALTSVTISAGTLTNNTNTLTVASGITTAASALVVSGGTLTNGGGSIQVGPAGGGNQTLLLSSGALTLSSGTINVNGNWSQTGGTFTQSGGTASVDGNGSSSVATGTALVAFASTFTLIGGTFIVVDPHAGTGATDYAFTASSSSAVSFATTHTFQFGDGSSTASGGHVNGFLINTFFGSQKVAFGNLVINNPSGTNRSVQSSFIFGVRGNLTITAGELLLPGTAGVTVSGNITNNGILTATAPVVFGTLSGVTTTAATAAQTVSGSGTFRNAQSGSTGNFTNVTFNNTFATSPAISFNIGSVSVTGAVTLTAGTVSVGINNDISFGSAASISRTAGYFLLSGTGQMKKTYTNTGSFVYHLGENTGLEQYSPVTLNLTSNATQRTIGVKVTDALHPQNGVIPTANNYLSRYWSFTDDQSAAMTYSTTLQYIAGTEDVTGTESQLRTASWNGSAWTAYTTTVSSPTLASTGITTALNGLDLTGRYGGAPTQFAITSISPTSPTAGSGFSVTVKSVDADANEQLVSQNTGFTLSVNGYGGTIGGTVSGIITSGSNTVTVSGVTLSAAGTNAVLTATQTSGDVLTPGNSASFTVQEAASKLVLVSVPTTGSSNTALTSFTVQALRSDNSVDDTYTGNITIAKASGPGTLSGTTTVAATAGVATFSTLKFDQQGTYTITASASGLTGATSSDITITYSPSSTDYFRSAVTSGTWSTGNWEASADGVTNWTATSLVPSNTSAGITIQSGHNITVSGTVTVDQVTVNGTLTVSSTTGTLNISDGSGDDITITNGGSLVITGTASYGSTIIPSGSANFHINNGGLIKFSGSGGSYNGFATSSTNIWDNGSIFEWNGTATPGMTGVTYFPNAGASTIPILRMSFTQSSLGGGTAFTLNGRLEATSNITFSGTGAKIFRNGITGTATVTQGSATVGAFQINGATADLGGVTLALSTNGLSLSSATAATLTSNLTANTGPITISGTLDAASFAISGTSATALASGATIKSAHANGIGGTFANTGSKTFSSGANYTFYGSGQNTGTFTTTPTASTVNTLEIAGTVTNTFGTTLNATNLTLISGTFSIGSGNTINIAASGTLTANGGTVATGASGGTIAFAGAGTYAGSSAATFNNITVNGGAISNTNSGNPTIGGTLLLASSAGSVGFTPIYASGATLNYGASFTRGNEWSATGTGTIGITPGYPHHVIVSSGTFALLNGDAATARAVNGDLTVSSGATFDASGRSATLAIGGNLAVAGTFSLGTTSARTSVAGNMTNAGTLTLSTAAGGDMTVGGNWSSSGTFTPNTQPITLDGSGNVTVALTGNFAELLLNKPSGEATLQSAITVTGALTLTSGKLVLGANGLTVGSIAGGSEASYIVTAGTGTVTRKALSGTQLLPVGISNTSYSPLTIYSTDGYDWKLGVQNGIQPRAGVWFSNDALQRTWQLTPYSAGTGNPVNSAAADLTFQWDISNTNILGTGTWNGSSQTAIVNHHNGTAWETAGGALDAQGTGPIYTLKISYSGSFSPFAISSSAMPLPVTLLSFSGKRVNSSNELKWITLTEQNNRGFFVERSLDGRSFTSAGFVNTRAVGGNNSGELAYSFLDNATSGTRWYYRLKQVDQDGRYKYSAVVVISADKSGMLLVDAVYPNPAKSAIQVRIQAAASGAGTVLLLSDMLGRIVKIKPISVEAGASTTTTIDISELANGVYHLKAVNGNGEVSETVKVVKQ
jgi:hypothetical protein